ncbi:hypothetical protein HG15A2_32850 [Adhaeretor mobilis]|uniref:Uncharacterized protein n=1 Tax=Adhaeretor mobilis TaxID=1930276 RepID=A0A517MYI9_9BACT|nr:hypothetical protein HG15A2_32850 [Adhaeretor mobilis]
MVVFPCSSCTKKIRTVATGFSVDSYHFVPAPRQGLVRYGSFSLARLTTYKLIPGPRGDARAVLVVVEGHLSTTEKNPRRHPAFAPKNRRFS